MNLVLALAGGVSAVKLVSTVAVVLASVAAVAMALSLADPNTAIRKARGSARAASTQEAIRALSHYLDYMGNPDIQFKAFSGLETADVVIADVGCTLLALYGKKPAASTTNAWLKGSNHATTAAANGDVVLFFVGTSGGGREHCPTFGDGLAFGTGLTLGCHTTVNGNTKSAAADAVTGFAIIGAALA